MSGCVANDQTIIVQRESVGMCFAGMRLTQLRQVWWKDAKGWPPIARSFQRVLNGELFGAKVPRLLTQSEINPKEKGVQYGSTTYRN